MSDFRQGNINLLWLWFGLLLWGLAAVAVFADETIVPATPVAPPGDAITRYFPKELDIVTDGFFDVSGNFTITTCDVNIVVVGFRADGQCARATSGGCETIRKTYSADACIALVNALNTANLTGNSLRKRVLAKLVTDGVIGGVSSGSPGLPTPLPTQGP